MLRFENMPDIVFVAADRSERSLCLREEKAEINRIAHCLRKSMAPGAVVGLLYPCGPNLVRNWLACLMAGLRPLILQFPNFKQNRGYWLDSVRNTIEAARVDVLMLDDGLAHMDFSGATQFLFQRELAGAAPPESEVEIGGFSVLQLSSGTTGFRKAIRFDDDAIYDHINKYNKSVSLTRDDVVVSWLPLYHDMGFIACFLAPLALGVKIVMIEPTDWVRQPDLLFHAISRHRGSICYMPNFGFEVMTRVWAPEMPSVRWWVSCSEPVSSRTVRKFLAHTRVDAARFAVCYAMAENVFAVSFGPGLRTASLEGVEVVCCGAPIDGVSIKIVDGQIWVKSASSLVSYVNGQDIRDIEGFYPTGDLGAFIEGELYVSGRRNDVLIQAGRKFMLSDVDLRVNEILPEARGRAVTVAQSDLRLGTEIALVLIEATDFFDRTDEEEIKRRLGEVAGIERMSVRFVPPRFLTKTTSGKFNRKRCLADWELALTKRQRRHFGITNPVEDLNKTFGHLNWEKPIAEILDSLSLTLARMLASEVGIVASTAETLGELRARMRQASGQEEGEPKNDVIRIVSLAERMLFDRLSERDLDELGSRLGAEVTFEHVCVPPSPIVLSDLIFSDYFQPRMDQQPFSAMDHILDKIRGASVLIVDDNSEMFFLREQIYAVMSHTMERDPRADLISVRWQHYSRKHDALPSSVVRGGDLALAHSTNSLARLSRYLSTPIFRIANFEGFRAFTEGWDWRPLRGNAAPLDIGAFAAAFGGWLQELGTQLHRRPAPKGLRLDMTDAIHYCSHGIKREPLDELLDHFDRFAIAGLPSSVPYIRSRLEKLGKSYTYIPSYAPEVVKTAGGPFDCILICGAMGDFEIEIPAIAVQHVGLSWYGKNLTGPAAKFASFDRHGVFADYPESGRDWFYPETLEWGQNHEEWVTVRMAVAKDGVG